MSRAVRTLASLPPEVLSEILVYVLDVPNGPRRPCVLRTCSLLRDIGHPLLFRFVRLATLATWTAMLQKGGLLIPEKSGGRGFGKYVKELSLDRKGDGDWSHLVPGLFLSLPSVVHLVLSHRILDSWMQPRPPAKPSLSNPNPIGTVTLTIPATLFRSIFSATPNVTSLAYLASPTPTYPYPVSSGRYKFGNRLDVASLLGITPDHRPGVPTPPESRHNLPRLRIVHMLGDLVLDDPLHVETTLLRGVAFSDHPSVETLVVSFAKDAGSQSRAESLYECLLEGSLESEWDKRWSALKRIEIRRVKGGAELMEKRWRKQWEKGAKTAGGGRKGSSARLGEMVVFVDEDGTERRLVDG